MTLFAFTYRTKERTSHVSLPKNSTGLAVVRNVSFGRAARGHALLALFWWQLRQQREQGHFEASETEVNGAVSTTAEDRALPGTSGASLRVAGAAL